MVLLKEQCRSFQDAVSAAQKELEELKARPVDVAVMAVDQEKIDAARSEAVAHVDHRLVLTIDHVVFQDELLPLLRRQRQERQSFSRAQIRQR